MTDGSAAASIIAEHRDDALARQQFDAAQARLKSSNLFGTIEIVPIDSEKLKIAYRALSNKVTRQISFERHTILPKISGVKRAFIGILPCKEYLRLITDDNEQLLRNVFYDNVRDYQGENAVNTEIIETLKGENSGSEIFVLLNNGVTVVAKSINPVGTDFTVRDFQVVNGCQTSHILYRNRDILIGHEFVTIKLIETDDGELTNKITKATNRQTEVKLEAFAGLQQFHKELEAFYQSIPVEYRLLYERRTGQFDGDSGAKKNRIVSIPNQIKSFVAVILEEPQKIHFYYGQLLRDYSTGDDSKLFIDSHDPYPYYAASWLAFSVNEHIHRKRVLELRPWRYHLAAMVRMLLAGPFSVARLSDSKFCKKYCDGLLEKIRDRDQCARTIDEAVRILQRLKTGHKGSNRDLPQVKALCDALMVECRNVYLGQSADVRLADIGQFDGHFVGKVKVIVPERSLGFIEYGHRQFQFSLGRVETKIGQRVRFRLKQLEQRTEAYDVTVMR